MLQVPLQRRTPHSVLAAALSSPLRVFQEGHSFCALWEQSALEGFFSGTKMILTGNCPCTSQAPGTELSIWAALLGQSTQTSVPI